MPTQEIDEEFTPPTIRWAGATPQINPSIYNGCVLCFYGLQAAPVPAGKAPLFEERRGQFENGELKFCTCRAGQMYRSYLSRLAREAHEADVRIPAAVKP